MLRFFRQIRQRLITENRFSKYLFYAVGEILLVVIGILIALQIDNWNEERKNRRLEKEYIARLKSEMLKNLEGSTDQILYSSFQVENVDKLLSALSGDTVYSNPEPLAVAIEHVGWLNPVQYVNDVWNELINNGNVRILQNDSLRNNLTSYHSKVLFVLNNNDEWNIFNLGYRRLSGDILDPQIREQIALKLNPIQYEGHLTNLPTQKYLVKKLESLEGLNGYLSDIKMGRRTNIMMFETLIARIEEIIKICDKELKK
jgi:hypothetical protein